MKTIDLKSSKFIQMMTLFNQTGKVGYRHTYAFKASKGRTESTKELTEPEVNHIIANLKALNPALQKFEPKAGDKQRKKMIAIARMMNWGDTKAILKRLDSWCKKQKFKKGLMQHNEAELGLLLTIFETKVYADYLKYLNP